MPSLSLPPGPLLLFRYTGPPAATNDQQYIIISSLLYFDNLLITSLVGILYYTSRYIYLLVTPVSFFFMTKYTCVI